ncbi:hypothetical protein [Roseovarius sp. MBR-6]|jgi:hypothetical protein|uniref:hypothetical protein n=1 Tax=Roseovarius sp. MBR-6 TaxID=3156459 RepID=UPI0033992141
MGWLDLIFGKGNAKTIKKVQKAASAIQPKVTPAPKATAPKVQWQKSEKGNDTAEIDGFRVTIFKQDDGWNYCIAEILDEEDIADGVEEAPEFGEWYPTKAEAKKAALEEVA